MAAGGECDFYAVLGLKKECSAAELRSAYKMLALRWHPDRCSASGNSKFVEEAKQKFQAIQEAYSVLSDANKRFLYDMGVYNGDDDDENGMGDFFGEMAVMMNQANAEGAREESFEELQELFEEMFQRDSYESSSFVGNTRYTSNLSTSNVSHPSNSSTADSSSSNTNKLNYKNRRNGSDMNSGLFNCECNFSTSEAGQSFCTGVGGGNSGGGGRNGRRNARKHKVSLRHDVSSCDSRIST